MCRELSSKRKTLRYPYSRKEEILLKKWWIQRKVCEYDRTIEELFADCELHEVESFDGTKIVYRSVGKGYPPIVHCPGVFTSYMFFHFMKDYFSPRHMMIFWDYRGHAPSETPKDLESINISNCARDLKAVLDDAGIEKAILTGHSMGVMTIIEFYRQFKERVLGLIPINGPYRRGFEFVSRKESAQKVIKSALDFLSKKPGLMEWFRPIVILPINYPLSKKVEVNPTMCPEREMTLYFDYIAKMDWKAGFKMLSAMAQYDGSEILPEIKVPTLIICGDNDSWAPMHIALKMHERISGSRLVVIPGGSHATPAENPQMINFAIEIFIRDNFLTATRRKGKVASKASCV